MEGSPFFIQVTGRNVSEGNDKKDQGKGEKMLDKIKASPPIIDLLIPSLTAVEITIYRINRPTIQKNNRKNLRTKNH